LLTIYVVRHAEAANPRGILYGRLPRIDLSAAGREQAALLSAAMAGLPLQAIYSSPLLRARRTAGAIAERHPGVPIVRSSLLLENRHPYQGRPHAEVARLGERAFDAEVLGAHGETIEDLRDRLMRFVWRAARRHHGGVIAIVGHADPLAAMRAHLIGKELTPASLRQEAPLPAAVFRLDLSDDGAARLDLFWKPPHPKKTKSSKHAASADSTESASESLPSRSFRSRVGAVVRKLSLQ
jgi:probable phosphoglycerate mutase